MNTHFVLALMQFYYKLDEIQSTLRICLGMFDAKITEICAFALHNTNRIMKEVKYKTGNMKRMPQDQIC